METRTLKGKSQPSSSLFGKPPGLVSVIAGNAVVFVVAVLQAAVYYYVLPEELPAHFDWQGEWLPFPSLFPPPFGPPPQSLRIPPPSPQARWTPTDPRRSSWASTWRR